MVTNSEDKIHTSVESYMDKVLEVLYEVDSHIKECQNLTGQLPEMISINSDKFEFLNDSGFVFSFKGRKYFRLDDDINIPVVEIQ